MKITLLLLIVQLISVNVRAQFQNIKIDDEGNPCEPSICINPKSPNKIVLAAVSGNTYWSDDFGKSWNKKEISSRYGIFGDPCLIADNDGKFYYFHLSDPQKNGWKSPGILDRIVCQHSQNGRRWNFASFAGLNKPKQQDKEWAVYDEHSNNIYLTWTQFDKYDSENPKDSSAILFSYSNDRGKTWKPSIRINKVGGDCKDSDNTAEGAMPAVGAKGEVYVTWALNDKIYFDKSIDGGIMWLKNDKIIATQTGGWDIKVPGLSRCNAFPVIACDLSYGKYHGNIYVSWADQRNGEQNTDIWLIKSDDGGTTWSEPKRVNDDNSERHQYMNWMTVDQVTGNIYLVFYDRRNHSDNATDVYLAYSNNGGESFKNVLISESSFTPDEDSFFGDYIGLSAFAGYVRPVWTRTKDGKTSLWTAIIDNF